jgi:hypothetical protein
VGLFLFERQQNQRVLAVFLPVCLSDKNFMGHEA